MRSLLPLAVLLVVPAGCGAPTEVSPEGARGEVTINVEFGSLPDRQDQSFTVAITEGQSAHEAMQTARDRGELEFETSEHAGSPFVSGIGGVSGEGTGDGRNWMYWVNGELATEGVGSLELHDGDELTWRFTTYDEARMSPTGESE